MHELTEVIHNHYPPYCRESCDVPSYVGGWAEHVAAAVQAELARANSVTTVEELDALPYNTILLDSDGDVYVVGDFNPVNLCAVGAAMNEPPALPAIVLFRPEVTP